MDKMIGDFRWCHTSVTLSSIKEGKVGENQTLFANFSSFFDVFEGHLILNQ